MSPFSLPDAFYHQQDEGRFLPTEATIGPWSSLTQHGGPPIALISRALRSYLSPPELEIARITAEILGPVPVEPCEITVKTLRPGKRIELLQAEMRCNDRVVLLAHAWLLERQPNCLEPVADPFTPPDLPGEQPQRYFSGMEPFPYAQAIEWRFTKGCFSKQGPATVWARPRIPLVNDANPHSLDALLLMLDSANGISAELDINSWSFVPVDLTLNMHRLPEGPWVGMDARTQIDSGGVGTVTTSVFDTQGALGRSLHTLFVRPLR